MFSNKLSLESFIIYYFDVYVYKLIYYIIF